MRPGRHLDRVYGQPSIEALAGLAEGKLLGAAPLLQDFGDSGMNVEFGATLDPRLNRTPAAVPAEPARLTGRDKTGGAAAKPISGPGTSRVMPSGETARMGGSIREDVTAGRDPLLSTDVTIELCPKWKELETSIITGATGPTRTDDLRFRKALLDAEQAIGIQGFRTGWLAPDDVRLPGNAWVCRGEQTSKTQSEATSAQRPGNQVSP